MNTKIIDFNKAKLEKIEEKRRKYERVLFKNVMGVYSVIENVGLSAIELVDFSYDGCAYQLPNSKNAPAYNVGETITLRVYFSEKSYLGVKVTIRNRTEFIENGFSYVRYGCELDKTQSSYKALKPFIDFIYNYAEEAEEEASKEKVLFYL